MESSIIPLGHKIDFMLARLDSVFKERKLKKDDMEKIFEGIVSNDEGGLQAYIIFDLYFGTTLSSPSQKVFCILIYINISMELSVVFF